MSRYQFYFLVLFWGERKILDHKASSFLFSPKLSLYLSIWATLNIRFEPNIKNVQHKEPTDKPPFPLLSQISWMPFEKCQMYFWFIFVTQQSSYIFSLRLYDYYGQFEHWFCRIIFKTIHLASFSVKALQQNIDSLLNDLFT